MSTPPPKAASDLAPPAPVFSYAQAAKGRTPSAPSSVQSTKSPSGSVTPSKESQEASRDIPDILMNGDSTGPSIISEKMSKRLTTTAKDVDTSNSASPEERSKISIPSVDKDSTAKPQNIALPASPSNSVAPSATIPRGDEGVSGTQVSADSSSDAKAQTPATDVKSNEQVGEDMAQSKDKNEEKEKEKAAALKPAPLPTVNFWQQRAKEATQLKSKSGTATSPSSNPVPQSPSPIEGGQMDQNRFNSKPSSVKGPETSAEARRKGVRAVSAGAEAERAGVNQGSVAAVKGGKKLNDVKARDDALKKSAPRSRSFAEKDLTSSGSMAPPPVADAMAWPTPETAQDEEKKRAQEKGPKVEKEKGPVSNARPQGKEKWVHVPYTPTAVFNTPLPSAKRGGRQSRGGRENGRGHTSNGSIGGERGSNSQNSTTGSTAETTERGRNESGNIRATSLPPKSTKRSTSAGGSNAREQRKYPTPLIPDRRREEEAVTGKDVESRTAAYHEDSSRRTSIATQTDSRNRFRQDTRPGRFDGANGTGQASINFESLERGQHSGPDGHAHPKSAGPDRRRESFVSNSDYGRDATQLSQSNTRGGIDRGRGGRHRGRGGPNAPSHQYATQQVSNGHTFQQPQSAPFSPTKSLTFSYGQSHQQSAQGSQYGGSQRSSRSYRDQSRTQSIPSSAVYGSFPHSTYGGQPQMAPLQTALPPYDFPVHPASAGPYPYAEPVPLVHLVTLQLEYYFSVDNLCKDMFLRKHMDSQGYVFLSVIANFNRIRQLTQDVELIRFAVMQTGEVEFRPGSDGVDRLRRRTGWEQFVLDMAERDESARNEGPSRSTPPPTSYPVAPDAGYLYQNRQIGSPTEFTGLEAGYAPYGMVPGYANPELAMNGMINGNSHYVETPLSAAVPDFSPSIPPINGAGFASLDGKKSEGDKFTDEQIDSLRIVVRTANPSRSPPGAPFHSAASRTFSNGSIDSRSMAAELNKLNSHSPRPHANGNGLAEPTNGDKLARAASPTDTTPQSSTHSTNGPSVFWIKDRTTETEQLPNGSAIEHYNDFRYNTLRERENGILGKDHSNMNVLFEFWSHFLVRNFNNRMYEEFRALAIEDALQRNSKTGMKHLVQFYDASMSNKEVMSDTLAQHYVELVQNESYNSDRPALAKMRSAWRNGALNMKTRKKIDSLADKDLKSLLEQ